MRTGADTQAVRDVFGQQNMVAVLVPRGDLASEAELSQAIAELEAGTYGAFNPLLLECLRDVKDRLAEEAGMDTPAPPQKKDYPLTKLLLDEV